MQRVLMLEKESPNLTEFAGAMVKSSKISFVLFWC